MLFYKMILVIGTCDDYPAGFYSLCPKDPHPGGLHKEDRFIYVVVIVMVSGNGVHAVPWPDTPQHPYFTLSSRKFAVSQVSRHHNYVGVDIPHLAKDLSEEWQPDKRAEVKIRELYDPQSFTARRKFGGSNFYHGLLDRICLLDPHSHQNDAEYKRGREYCS